MHEKLSSRIVSFCRYQR